jgi:Protein of unknown function (DUF3800)
MPLYNLYIDDSGTKDYASHPKEYRRNGNTRYFVFGAILISNDEASRITNLIKKIKLSTFHTEDVEIKSNWIRIPHEREARYINNYNVSDAEFNQFIEHIYNIIINADLEFIVSVIDKQHMHEDYENPWYAPAIAYELILQRVARNFDQDTLVRVTIDDMSGATPKGNQYKKNLTRHHKQLCEGDSRLYKGFDFTCLSEKLKFQNSKLSEMLQLADLIAYNVYRQFVEYGEEWEIDPERNEEGEGKLPTYEFLNKIDNKFRQGPDNRIQGYGIIKFPLRNRIRWQV